MHTRNCQNFKGEIEFYLKNGQNVYDSKIDSVFQSLKFKTWLCRANIKKQEGYHAAHLLFILFMLPLLQLKTVNSFCRKQWQQWSRCRKDTYYRFKQNTSYRWRTFMKGINHEIFDRLDLHGLPQKDLCFVIDNTILQKAGRKIENVTYVHDHNLGRSILGFCVVALGECAFESSCSKSSIIDFDSGYFQPMPTFHSESQEAIEIRKNCERPFNLMKKREGLEQTRVRSQHGVIVRSTLTTIVTLLLEMAGTRHKSKKKEDGQKELFAATG
jgi:hypothetical protein